MTGQGRRRDESPYKGADQGTQGRPGWDEVPSRDPYYDPTVPHQPRYWEDGSGEPQGNPHDRQPGAPTYHYQPPPGAYGQYPPPVYANPYMYPYYYRRPPNPNLPTIGGVLSMISGATGFYWTATAFGGPIGLLDEFAACFIISTIFSLTAIFGGMMAVMKRMFPLAVLGAICAMLNWGLFGMNIVLGIVALVLILISKDVFNSNVRQPLFVPRQ